MTEVKLPKYRVVIAWSPDELQEKMNALADEGYIFADMKINPRVAYPDGTLIDEVYIAMMKIGESDYHDVVALKDVAPELVTEALSLGWELVSTSLSTKFCRMVRRKRI